MDYKLINLIDISNSELFGIVIKNCVLLSSDNTKKYARIKDSFFKINTHPLVKPNEIYMSAILRTELDVEIGDVVTVHTFLDEIKQDMPEMTISINSVVAPKSETNLCLSIKDIVKDIKDNYKDHIFYSRKRMMLKSNSQCAMSCSITINRDEYPLKVGYLAKDTKIYIDRNIYDIDFSIQRIHAGEDLSVNIDGLKNKIMELYADEFFHKGRIIEISDNGSKYKLTCMRVGSTIGGNCGFLIKYNGINITLSGFNKSLVQNWNFKEMNIGGLDDEAATIFTRAFASRFLPPEEVQKADIKHEKGLLLYGPPGTGKTLIARELSKILNVKKENIKITGGSEFADRFYGETEKKVRALFEPAEIEFKEKGLEAELHVLIIDEIDALCTKRGRSSGESVNDKVVNQLLTKLDGIESASNFLLIGLTNRKDLLDEALLRPGRIGIHVEIGLPDFKGRKEIFEIHMKALIENNYIKLEESDLDMLANMTKNFSGAEIEGSVRVAKAVAFGSQINLSDPFQQVEFKVTLNDIINGINSITPAYGRDIQKELSKDTVIPNNLPDPYFLKIDKHRVKTLLIHSDKIKGGKSTAALFYANQLGFPFIKVVSPYEAMRDDAISIIDKHVQDAYKSKESIIILEDIDLLIGYNGPGRYNDRILSMIKSVIKSDHAYKDRILLIIATTSRYDIMRELDLHRFFDEELYVDFLDSKNLKIV